MIAQGWLLRKIVTEEESRVRQRRVLRQLLGALTAEEREALTRYYLQQQSPEQIEEELGVSVERLQDLKSRFRAAYLASEKSQ